MDKLHGCIFSLKIVTYQKNIIGLWDNVSADVKKEFNSEPVYNKKYLKSKIKSHADEVTDIYDKTFLSQTLIILVQQ